MDILPPAWASGSARLCRSVAESPNKDYVFTVTKINNKGPEALRSSQWRTWALPERDSAHSRWDERLHDHLWDGYRYV